MVEMLSDPQRTYLETLECVGKKLYRLFDMRPKRRERSPVDCVAYSSAYVSVDGENKVDGHYHPICNHPDRGKQFGCLLTREEEGGRIRRTMDRRTCSFRVKNGRRGAVELERRMMEPVEEFPF